ncbi:hypothetical protein TEA_004116 [Camellia sinensis var. sinensis]|uniref:Uncharacterized protein n=1 Tax=Camellia sinensis var. sinensis TaxID=542762 RepID=A0A4S4EU23_CAMSN|nr:hypothetical protein TEA_004116 [Camellia sinensis var. sinensis]
MKRLLEGNEKKAVVAVLKNTEMMNLGPRVWEDKIVTMTKWEENRNHKNLPPPSPPKLPIVGNLHQLGLFPHRSLRSLAQKYGPLMQLHFGSVPVLIVSSAVAAQEIMKTHDLAFSSRPKTINGSKLIYDCKDVALSPYGKYWRQVRSICVVHLLSNRMVQSFQNVRKEETALMIENIKNSSSSSSSSLVNLTDMFVTVTNNIVCRVALGKKYSGTKGGRRFKELLATLGELMGAFNVGDYIPWLVWMNRLNGLDAKVENISKEIDEFLEGVVEEHVDRSKRDDSYSVNVGNENKHDFVDLLLQIQPENTSGSLVDRDTIKALILDMFVAGTDTKFTTMEWTMAELLKHPRIMKKLQNEVREIAKGKLNITEDDLVNMHYLKAVIKESLRIHPPVFLVPRESIQETKVMGYDIVAGMQVFVNAWAIGRDPLSWEDPEEFRPERFLNSSIDFKGHDFEFIPFGAGRRGCPGTLFAMNVNELAFASVVHKFDLSLPDGSSGEDLDMTEAVGLIIHKKTPLIVVPTPYSC